MKVGKQLQALAAKRSPGRAAVGYLAAVTAWTIGLSVIATEGRDDYHRLQGGGGLQNSAVTSNFMAALFRIVANLGHDTSALLTLLRFGVFLMLFTAMLGAIVEV